MQIKEAAVVDNEVICEMLRNDRETREIPYV